MLGIQPYSRYTFNEVSAMTGYSLDKLGKFVDKGLQAYYFEGVWWVQGLCLNAFIETQAQRKGEISPIRIRELKAISLEFNQLSKVCEHQLFADWEKRGLPWKGRRNPLALIDLVRFLYAPNTFSKEGFRLNKQEAVRDNLVKEGYMTFDEYDQFVKEVVHGDH